MVIFWLGPSLEHLYRYHLQLLVPPYSPTPPPLGYETRGQPLRIGKIQLGIGKILEQRLKKKKEKKKKLGGCCPLVVAMGGTVNS